MSLLDFVSFKHIQGKKTFVPLFSDWITEVQCTFGAKIWLSPLLDFFRQACHLVLVHLTVLLLGSYIVNTRTFQGHIMPRFYCHQYCSGPLYTGNVGHFIWRLGCSGSPINACPRPHCFPEDQLRHFLCQRLDIVRCHVTTFTPRDPWHPIPDAGIFHHSVLKGRDWVLLKTQFLLLLPLPVNFEKG